MKMKKGSAIRPVLGEGTHDVTIKEITLEYDVDTIYGLKDVFHIRYQSDRGKSISQKYIAYYDASSSFGKVVQAVFGELPEDLDTNHLVGKRCIITVTPKVSKQNKTYFNVVKVEPSERPSVRESVSALFDE